MDNVKIGKMLEKYRKEKGISQAEIAKKAGMSQQQISQYEKGTREPKIENISKIFKALGISATISIGSKSNGEIIWQLD